MTLLAYTGSLNVPGATGNQAITGVGFQPKAILFWSAGIDTDDTWDVSTQNAIHPMLGMVVGAGAGNAASYQTVAQDAQTTSNPKSTVLSNANCIQFSEGGAVTIRAAATLASFDADGFTLNWGTIATARPQNARVFYLALGGDELVADIAHWNVPAVTGNHAVSGLAFQPDVVLHLCPAANVTTAASTATSAFLGLGAMDAAGNEWIMTAGEDEGSTTVTGVYQRTDKCIVTPQTDLIAVAADVDSEAEFVSMDSGGFTVNFTTADGTGNEEAIASLCLGGLNARVGFFAKDTGAAPDTQSITGVGFVPRAVLLASVAQSANTSPDTAADFVFALGAADGTRERSILAVSRDNLADSDVAGINQADKVLALREGGTVTAVDAEADLTSFDADGFTLNWTTNNAEADQIGFIAFGDDNTAPNAPALTYPVGAVVIDRAVTNRFTWTFSDPDAGDMQSAYELRYRAVGAPSWTTVTGGATEYHDFVGGTFTAGDFEWQVRTTDNSSVTGPFSASAFFTADDTPATPALVTPINNGTIDSTLYLVTWTAAEQEAYQLRRVADSAGSPNTAVVYFDTGSVVSTVRQRSVTFETNNRFEHVQLRVRDNGLWSDWDSHRVEVSYTPPPTPTVVLTADDDDDTITIAITNPAPGMGEPTVVSNDVELRAPNGDDSYVPADGLRIAQGVANGGSFVYRAPASGVTYEARAVAYGANDTTATGAWTP